MEIYQEWHVVRGGETMSIKECRKLSPVDQYVWGDTFHYLYRRDDDGKLFMYSECYSCQKAREGCFVQYCYISRASSIGTKMYANN
jgi:hypothetical protein